MVFSHLDNTELISHLHRERMASPVIDELIKRLEVASEHEGEPVHNAEGHCPICKAMIEVWVNDESKVVFTSRTITHG